MGCNLSSFIHQWNGLMWSNSRGNTEEAAAMRPSSLRQVPTETWWPSLKRARHAVKLDIQAGAKRACIWMESKWTPKNTVRWDGKSTLFLVGLCDIVYLKSIVSYYVLSFISWCRKIHCFPVIPFHHLGDCDLYTPPRSVKGRQKQVENDRLGYNQELVPKRGSTSVAWSCVFKHCSFKTFDFKPLKIKQQSYMRAPSLSVWEERAFSFLQTLNNYINTLVFIPLVGAPIREWNAIEEAECRAKEDIPELGCREGLEEVTPSTMKESPRRPCLGWWRVKRWTERWPARGPYAVGKNRLGLLTRGPLAAKGQTVEGERPTRPPTARPKKNDDGLFLHTKPRGVGRYAFAVWSHLVVVKQLSSSRLEGQERLGGAEAASLLGRFRSTHLRGRWQGKGWPRAPQTVVGGECAAWAPLLPEGSFLGRDCSLDKEEEGVEWSLVLLGINCLRAADCVLTEQNFSTTELTATPNNPDCEMGASSRNTFSFSRISVRLSHKCRSAATEPAIERPCAALLLPLESDQSLHPSPWVRPPGRLGGWPSYGGSCLPDRPRCRTFR